MTTNSTPWIKSIATPFVRALGLTALAATLSLTAAACGGGDDPEPEPEQPAPGEQAAPDIVVQPVGSAPTAIATGDSPVGGPGATVSSGTGNFQADANATVYAYSTEVAKAMGTYAAGAATIRAIRAGTPVAVSRTTGGTGSRAGGGSSASTNFPTNAWRGEYFASASPSGRAIMTRNDAAIDFHWGLGAPAPGLPVDGFSVRWQRRLQLDAGAYRFHVDTDDGVRITVGSEKILDKLTEGPKRESADVGLAAGGHDVKIEYYEYRGEAYAKVWWERVDNPSFPEWKAEYYGNANLEGSPVLVRNEKTPNKSWALKSPHEAVPVDNWSARFTRSIQFDEGEYEFSAKADDGVRVKVDGRTIIDEWHGGDASTTYKRSRSLDKGGHTIVIEYYDATDKASLNVTWKRLGALPPSATPTMTPTGTIEPTPTVPTSTPTLSPTPSMTFTPSPTPTETEEPTETPTPEPTETETPEPTETETPEPTPTETPVMRRRG